MKEQRTVVRIYLEGNEVFAQWRLKGITNLQVALINARLDTIKLSLVDGMLEHSESLSDGDGDEMDKLLDGKE